MLLSSYDLLEINGTERIIYIFDGKERVECVIIGRVILGLEAFETASGIHGSDWKGIFKSPETVLTCVNTLRDVVSGGFHSFGQILFLKIYFIYLFLAALGLHCCTRAFSSCGEWGLLFIAVHGLLIAVASLDAEHGL